MVLIGRPLMPIVFDVRWLPRSPSWKRNQAESSGSILSSLPSFLCSNKNLGPGASPQRLRGGKKLRRNITGGWVFQRRAKVWSKRPSAVGGKKKREKEKCGADEMELVSASLGLTGRAASISWCLDACGRDGRRWKATRCPNSATLRIKTSAAARCISGCISGKDTLWVIQAAGAVKGTFCKLLVIYCRLLFNRSRRRAVVLTALRQKRQECGETTRPGAAFIQ